MANIFKIRNDENKRTAQLLAYYKVVLNTYLENIVDEMRGFTPHEKYVYLTKREKQDDYNFFCNDEGEINEKGLSKEDNKIRLFLANWFQERDRNGIFTDEKSLLELEEIHKFKDQIELIREWLQDYDDLFEDNPDIKEIFNKYKHLIEN